MRLFITTIFFSFLIPFIRLDAFVLPWERQVDRKMPWGGSKSAARKEARHKFFNRLSFIDDDSQAGGGAEETSKEEDEIESLSSSKQSSEPEVIETEIRHEGLKDLPWQTYDKAYRRSGFPSVLQWPVENGELLSGYGYRRGRPHEGLDIKGRRGEIVRATAAGKVTFNGVMNGYGRILVIAHGDGMTSIYAHNMANLVRYGDEVKAAQPVAHMGMSGNARGHHVHFEIRKNGKPVNPLQYQFRGSPLVARTN